MPWSSRLSAPITLDDRRVFKTLRDDADYVLSVPEVRRKNHHWQYAIEAMMKPARPKSRRDELLKAESLLVIALEWDGMLSSGGRVRGEARKKAIVTLGHGM